MESTKFISLKDLPNIKMPEEMTQWTHSSVPLNEPLLISGPVVAGFKRGSAQLGIPTANIEMNEENTKKTNELVAGVYAGIATLNG
jgi:FAD synthase